MAWAAAGGLVVPFLPPAAYGLLAVVASLLGAAIFEAAVLRRVRVLLDVDSRHVLFLGEDGSRKGTLEFTQAALEANGLTGLHMPRPVHLFRRTDVDAEGNFVMMETPSKAGDGVVLSVERNMVIAIAVPDDEISPVTGCNPTPIQVEISGVV